MNEKAVDAREKARRELEASKPAAAEAGVSLREWQHRRRCGRNRIVERSDWWRGMAVRRDGEIQVRR